MTDTPSKTWTAQDSEELYQIPAWGRGYFRAGKNGRLQVRPRGDRGPSFDLHRLVTGLVERGYSAPLLLRFGDILDDRIELLNGAFAQALQDWEYRGALPRRLPDQGQPAAARRRGDRAVSADRFGLGLEVGSKPELLIALGTTRRR
jgi:arginine decarboxylase